MSHYFLRVKQRDLSVAINFYPISIYKEKCVFLRTHRSVLNQIAISSKPYEILWFKKNETISITRENIMYLKWKYIIFIKILLSFSQKEKLFMLRWWWKDSAGILARDQRQNTFIYISIFWDKEYSYIIQCFL